MFKKTREKISQNENFILMKKLWDNKRYRSLLILGLYFVFFFVVISALRNGYQANENMDNNKTNNNFVSAETIKEHYNNLKDFSYRVLLNNELLIEGNVKDSINNFSYKKQEYTIILDNIYEKDDEDLKKIESLDSEELIIPINKIMINNIINYVMDIEITKELNNDGYEVYYDIPLSYFLIDEDGFAKVCVSGHEQIEKVTIDLTDYKKEIYSISIIIGDNNA